MIKKAWKDNEQNKEISIYGKAIKLTHLVTKILPHSLFLQFIGGNKETMKEITITKREEGQRFDKFLIKYLPGASSGFLTQDASQKEH